ncbi:hypothetical protein CK203_116309 [Vitis vinifera]|uniref:Integrase zinc-binding domain-containing protein n=1 Tax=Vitis vinifera TaxID=29760 RepID=A0A438CDD3_VITVI|nr:hypothetical protein CK203_116309 [Vitis vinifera]
MASKDFQYEQTTSNHSKALLKHSFLHRSSDLHLEVEGIGSGEVMKEAHQSRFTIHPGETKMYHDLRRQCWWQGMKWDIAEFLSKC